MLDVVRLRLAPGSREDPQWQVSRDVKRLEKTGAFLRSKLGLQRYFPRSLEVMKRGEVQAMGGRSEA